MGLSEEQQKLAPQLVYKFYAGNLMCGLVCGALLVGVLKVRILKIIFLFS